MALHNEIFSDDVRLESVVRLPENRISIVISQPTIKGRAATEEEIDELMETRCFQRFAQGIYYDASREVLLYDLHPRNVLVDENEIPHVIDPVIQRVTPEFAAFIRGNFYLVDRSF